MTIAISIKVHDGLVLSADSASTIAQVENPTGVINVYNNANKIFNLYKGLPIGGMTWGAGSIGTASISSLAKDLRRRLMGEDPDHLDWRIQPETYTIQEVAARIRQFMYDEKYAPIYQNAPTGPETGVLVSGYSAGQTLAEDWLVVITQNAPAPVLPRAIDDVGAIWYGQGEAVARIVKGYGGDLPQALMQIGIPLNRIPQAMDQITQIVNVPLMVAPMPIQDAIDLGEFLVHVAIMFSRFTPGAPSVGGPIEIAAITKHEGFKWIKRKHYFTSVLNPS
jgi:hypothetical protein